MPSPYEKALAAIDAAHALDPNKIIMNSEELSYELHYAQKCTAYLDQRSPSASETLCLAIRAQHFRRWEVPRNTYPMTRVGYHAWRSFLKTRQASLVHEICVSAGYSAADAERVASLIRKEDLKNDSETQVLEDVACLVFLDDQFEKFEKECGDDEKVVGILKKTWNKMTEEGHVLAMKIPMEGKPRELLEKALGG